MVEAVCLLPVGEKSCTLFFVSSEEFVNVYISTGLPGFEGDLSAWLLLLKIELLVSEF
jgi:hypothetical protein